MLFCGSIFFFFLEGGAGGGGERDVHRYFLHFVRIDPLVSFDGQT